MSSCKINFKEARIWRGLTQKELAEKIDVPARTYGAWERGEREPNLEDAFNVAVVLNCSLDFLVGVISKDEEENNQRIARINHLVNKLNKTGQEKVISHCIDLLGNRKFTKDYRELPDECLE